MMNEEMWGRQRKGGLFNTIGTGMANLFGRFQGGV